MKLPCLYTLDYSESLLSVFDISGSLLLGDALWQSKDIKHDVNQLMIDLDCLEEDYRNAFEKVMGDEAV